MRSLGNKSCAEQTGYQVLNIQKIEARYTDGLTATLRWRQQSATWKWQWVYTASRLLTVCPDYVTTTSEEIKPHTGDNNDPRSWATQSSNKGRHHTEKNKTATVKLIEALRPAWRTCHAYIPTMIKRFSGVERWQRRSHGPERLVAVDDDELLLNVLRCHLTY